ncbi:hypothetical protein, partial [Yersinia pekkanenii]|uniref:hypothetical protein n=1 Tax=Yersinia pekkanenii TaxID=1288385 RepID=UPI001F2FFF02
NKVTYWLDPDKITVLALPEIPSTLILLRDKIRGSVALRRYQVACCFFTMLPAHVSNKKSLPSPALSH